MKLSRILLGIARALTVLILAFVLFFVAAYALGDKESGDLVSAQDKVSFVFFPVLYVVGLAISLRWKMIGAVLSLFSILILFVIRPDLLQAFWFLLFLVPGVFYVLSWWLGKYAETEKL